MAINMAYGLLQLLKMKRLVYIWDRFGSIDHNGASRVSTLTKKADFVHTANGLELIGRFRHAVHTLVFDIWDKEIEAGKVLCKCLISTKHYFSHIPYEQYTVIKAPIPDQFYCQ